MSDAGSNEIHLTLTKAQAKALLGALDYAISVVQSKTDVLAFINEMEMVEVHAELTFFIFGDTMPDNGPDPLGLG